jgi:hypothetical protein
LILFIFVDWEIEGESQDFEKGIQGGSNKANRDDVW